MVVDRDASSLRFTHAAEPHGPRGLSLNSGSGAPFLELNVPQHARGDDPGWSRAARNADGGLDRDAVLDFRRQLAVRADARESTGLLLSSLWPELLTGTRRFVDTFFTAQRCYAIVESSAPREPTNEVVERGFVVLERVLLGQSQKTVATELRLSGSTVSAALKACLQSLGAPGRGSTPPMLLILAARSMALGSELTRARISRLQADAGERWAISVERPDTSFPVPLSKAEAQVIGALIEGHTHAQIASSRGTSRRTIANQLAIAFRKLGVSGRTELIERLARRDW